METYTISDDPADIDAGLAPEYYGNDLIESCDGTVSETSGLVAAARGVRAAFSSYPRRPGSLDRYGSASHRGWGSGWPSCPSSRMSAIVGGGVRMSVRREIAPIVAVLLNYAETKLNYSILSGQTAAFACRPIRGTSTPSNHSWGLAVDVNWQANPMSSRFRSNLPPQLVSAFWASGFYWGGWYNGGRYDTMHFEYTGRPSDAAKHLRAAQSLGDSKPPAAASATKVTVSVSKLKAAYNAQGTGDPFSDVKQLQARLNQLGYKCGTPDGYYGERTRDAMSAYRAKKYGTYAGHPDTIGPPGRQSLTDLGFKVVD